MAWALSRATPRADSRRAPRGLRVRCSAYPNVHWRTSVQVTVVCVPPWTVLDLGELQLKLQLELGDKTGELAGASAYSSPGLRRF